MQEPAKPVNEQERIADLRSRNILDTPIDKGFEAITNLGRQLYNVPIVAVSLIDENRQWFKSIQGLDVSETGRDISFCGHAILQQDIFYIPDATQDERFADNPLVTNAPFIRFYAGCPIVSDQGHILGTVCLIDHVPRMFAPGQMSGLRNLAALAELAINSATSQQTCSNLINQVSLLDRQSKIDHLTRAWNRRGGEEMLAQLADRRPEISEGFSLAIIDIDKFKTINDTYGHDAGDECLRVVSQRIISALREGDILVRWGGDEFLAIFDCVDPGLINMVLERVAEAVRCAAVKCVENEIRITLSIGSSVFIAGETQTWKDAFSMADKALYEAKSAGRDQVCIKESPSN